MTSLSEAVSEESPLWRSALGLVLDAAGIGVWEYDHVMGRNRWSPTLCALLGYGPEQTLASLDAWLALVHPDDLPTVREQVARALASDDSPYEAEYRLRAADGRWIWFYARGRVARDEAGQPTRTMGIMVDTSERKHAELLVPHHPSVYPKP